MNAETKRAHQKTYTNKMAAKTKKVEAEEWREPLMTRGTSETRGGMRSRQHGVGGWTEEGWRGKRNGKKPEGSGELNEAPRDKYQKNMGIQKQRNRSLDNKKTNTQLKKTRHKRTAGQCPMETEIRTGERTRKEISRDPRDKEGSKTKQVWSNKPTVKRRALALSK